ncbi:MAG TPA: hypothetical protein VFC41_02450, partial [Anaerovoracaceae bacterium]|nr:hypothetical protein [Anaerovoracaceae bacterium]
MKNLILSILVALFLMSCSKPENVKLIHVLPPIYPDYIDVTIPVNVAPLNFLMRNKPDKMVVSIKGDNDSITVYGMQKIEIPLIKWKTLLASEQGKSLSISVTAFLNGQWIKYESFFWHVKSDSINPFLSYRLIEPGYEVWNKIQLVERNLTSFDERVIADNNLTDGSCMNCHIYGNQNAALSMFH